MPGTPGKLDMAVKYDWSEDVTVDREMSFVPDLYLNVEGVAFFRDMSGFLMVSDAVYFSSELPSYVATNVAWYDLVNFDGIVPSAVKDRHKAIAAALTSMYALDLHEADKELFYPDAKSE